MGDKYEIRKQNGKVIVEKKPTVAEQVLGAFILITLAVWLMQGIIIVFIWIIQFLFKHPKVTLIMLIVAVSAGVYLYGPRIYAENQARQIAKQETVIAIEPRFMPTTIPQGILIPGDFWYQNGMEVQVGKPNFSPDCSGVFGFEIVIINKSGKELNVNFSGSSLTVADDSGNAYSNQNIWWKEGISDTRCYSSGIDSLYIQVMKPGERKDLAFRILPQNNVSVTQFNITISAGQVQNAKWSIQKP